MTFEQAKHTKALAWTAGVHILLLLLFLLVRYTMPVQVPVEELGLEVNLGTSEQGFGTDQPEMPDDPAADAAVAVHSSAPDQGTAAREVHTTEEEDAPVVFQRRTENNKKTTPQPTVASRNRSTPNTTRATTNQASTTRPQNPRYVYAGGTGTGGNSAQTSSPGGNEGIGQGDGDMGVPGGTPGAANYSGTPGGGTSIGHSISGRNIVQRPDPKAEFREGGKVVIRVTVNREGLITDSRVLSAANATIRALAEKKLRNVRFNNSPSAPAEQFGNITFDFKTTRK